LPPPIASSKNSPSPLEDEDVGDPCKSKSNVECLTEETQKDLNSGQVGKVIKFPPVRVFFNTQNYCDSGKPRGPLD